MDPIMEKQITSSNHHASIASPRSTSRKDLYGSWTHWWKWNYQISSTWNISWSSSCPTSDFNTKISTKFGHSYVVSYVHVGSYLSQVNNHAKDQSNTFFISSGMLIHRFGTIPMWNYSKFNEFNSNKSFSPSFIVVCCQTFYSFLYISTFW